MSHCLFLPFVKFLDRKLISPFAALFGSKVAILRLLICCGESEIILCVLETARVMFLLLIPKVEVRSEPDAYALAYR